MANLPDILIFKILGCILPVQIFACLDIVKIISFLDGHADHFAFTGRWTCAAERCAMVMWISGIRRKKMLKHDR
jgi:hypothetical protein